MKDKLSAAAFFVILAYVSAGICCEVYARYCRKYDIVLVYEKGDIDNAYQPPSLRSFFGTDFLGRDVFWRALFSVRTALKVGLVSGIIAGLIGTCLGILAAYYGGWTDDLVVWIYSTFAAIPTLLFVLSFSLLFSRGFLFPPLADAFERIAAFLGTDPRMMAIYLGIGFTGWVSLCRVVRAETMKLKQMPYVESSRALGFGNMKIIFRDILPNLLHLVIVYFTMRFAYAVMTEVIVSYLGFGVNLQPSWGVMISDGQQRLWRGIWWEIGAATFFMFFLVLALHILGDALRDEMDPRLNKET